jgi:transcription antitermination factor NusB
MTELETLERAKMYMEKLANGINPLDGSMLPDEDIVNNVRLSRCFFYVADVLRQIIDNGGVVSKKKPKKATFALTTEQRAAFEFSATPLPISELSKRINSLSANENMTTLGYTVIRDWLMSLGMLEEVLDEQSILWNDDLGFALIMVTRTLSNMRPSHRDVKVLPKFKSDEDLDFAMELFEKAAVNYDSNLEVIEQFTRNWDIERIAFMDNVIMVTAMAELVSFPSIPVKVTLDEYIEIAKYYSTASSSTFINGVLDKVVTTLTEEGRINKSGRGLI